MQENRLRHVPSVEKLIQGVGDSCDLPRAVVAAVVREEVAETRKRLEAGEAPEALGVVMVRVRGALERLHRSALRPVINGTGVALHTNLGRAPLGRQVAEAVAVVATGYSNLEIDLETGERGPRAPLVDRLLSVITGAESACVVNNCAAAVVLVLRCLCGEGRKEVIISRGELVEIGGGFRVPEIIETSGATLREVGTTNKTTVADYEREVGPRTAAILRVHRSNFYQEGFTETPELADLAALARRAGVPLVEDLGSGAMVDTAGLGPLEHEPTVAESLRGGSDLVCVSGDKLFGGPQAGIITGKNEWVSKVRRDPFFRVLRCDKLMLAALQETAWAYLRADRTVQGPVPVLALLSTEGAVLRARAERIAGGFGSRVGVGEGTSRCGGGTMPRSAVPSVTLDIDARDIPEAEMARRLRLGEPPVVGYVENGRVKIDLRTVFPEQDEALVAAVRAALG
ncbi:MAG: L-seryl-tRNA(Sec) selenium transferase [Verrucomicrobiales bacterium]